MATDIDALPCCKPYIFKVLRKPKGYPKKLFTVGGHIKAKRLDKGLYLKELAKTLKITTDTLINWENEKHRPLEKPCQTTVQALPALLFAPCSGQVLRMLFELLRECRLIKSSHSSKKIAISMV